MNNVNKLGVEFRCMVGRQVAHGSAVTVFLQNCESDSQWTVNFFMQVKPAALSMLWLAGLKFSSQNAPLLPCSLFRLNQELSGIQTLVLFSELDIYLSLRSRTLTAKPQCDK